MSTVSTIRLSISPEKKGIIVTARACDETIEAIELKDYPFGVGVQWHPECMFRTSPEMRTLFKNFVEHCSVSGE